jgi:hypothetical protein
MQTQLEIYHLRGNNETMTKGADTVRRGVHWRYFALTMRNELKGK